MFLTPYLFWLKGHKLLRKHGWRSHGAQVEPLQEGQVHVPMEVEEEAHTPTPEEAPQDAPARPLNSFFSTTYLGVRRGRGGIGEDKIWRDLNSERMTLLLPSLVSPHWASSARQPTS